MAKGRGRFYGSPEDDEEKAEQKYNNNNIDNKKDNVTDNKNNIDKDIVIDTKKDIKKYIKVKPPKPEGYHCRLPHEYINAIDEAKIITGFYKDELAQMAYELLFKKLGIEIKNGK
jgi:heme oxygenase